MPTARRLAALSGLIAQASLSALLTLASPAARAHPHGSLDCRVGLVLAPAGLVAVDLQLTMDSASTALLLPRLALGNPNLASPAAKVGLAQRQLLAGLMRQSAWMLQLRPLPAGQAAPARPAGAPPANVAPLALNDPDDPQMRLDDQGRLAIQVRLVPEAGSAAPAASTWQVSCQDPSAYWLAGFERAEQLSAQGPSGQACQASLGVLDDMAKIALALQAVARHANAPGADQMAPQLRQSTGQQRTPYAQISC